MLDRRPAARTTCGDAAYSGALGSSQTYQASMAGWFLNGPTMRTMVWRQGAGLFCCTAWHGCGSRRPWQKTFMPRRRASLR